MLIKSVTFEIVPEGKERFSEKIRKDLASLSQAEGCLLSECWVSENKTSIEFHMISKWEDKKYFQAWMKRPEHLQKHREAHQQKKEGTAKPSIVLNKSMAEYTPFE